MNPIVVSSLRQVIKPGYGLAPRSHTFSSATTTGSTHIGVPVSFFASLRMYRSHIFKKTPNGVILSP